MNPWILCFGGLGLVILAVAVLADHLPPAPHPDAPEEDHHWHAFLVAHRELI